MTRVSMTSMAKEQMGMLRYVLFLSFISSLSVTATASQSQRISWRDLLPSLPSLEQPFAKLTTDQIQDMRTHVRWAVAAPVDRRDDKFREAAEAALNRLTAAGIDVEKLMQQRRSIILQRQRDALKANPKVLGMRVRLPGYVVPLEFNGDATTEFLLVPTVGACVHTPPPPSNQIVHVTYPGGLKLDELSAAVWVEGPLEAEGASIKVGYSDGVGRVKFGYSMDAVSVYAY